jgi:hypothetical protein
MLIHPFIADQEASHVDAWFTDCTINNVGRDQHNYYIRVATHGSAGDQTNAEVSQLSPL